MDSLEQVSPDILSRDHFDWLKEYFGFGPEDERVLAALYPRIESRLSAIVDLFYDYIMQHEGTRRIIEGPEQLERLKVSFRKWLDELFLGPHDGDYFDRRVRIGRRHVVIGLPQTYVCGAMASLRSALHGTVFESGGEEQLLQEVSAVCKAVDLDLALIAGSYYEAEKYRDLVEQAPSMIHTVDREGRIMTVNETECRELGYTRDELLSKRMHDLVPAEDHAHLAEQMATFFASGVGGCELRLRRHDGTLIDVETRCSPRHDPATGEIVGALCYVRDVTERRKAAEALRRERDFSDAVLDTAGALVVVLDRDGRIVRFNRECERTTGWKAAEVKGRPFWDMLLADEDIEPVKAVFADLSDTALPSKHRNHWLTRDGERRLIDWSNTILTGPDGTIDHIVGTGIDVTEREALAQQLLEQESLTRLGKMAAVVAHEVKNPLAAIIGAVQILGSRFADGSEERGVSAEIVERVSTLNETVQDLLLYARPRQPSKAPAEVRRVVSDTVAALAADPSLRKVEVVVEGEPVVAPIDQSLMKPVFVNLVLNAAEAFDGRKGRIQVSVAAENGACRIDVVDDGPGVPAEARGRLFEPFFTTKGKGTGLGLAIAKRMVDLHGGRIDLTCPEQGGTRVTIRLPLARDPD